MMARLVIVIGLCVGVLPGPCFGLIALCDLDLAMIATPKEKRQDLFLAFFSNVNPPSLGKSQTADNEAYIALVDKGYDPNVTYLHESLKVMKVLNDRTFAGEDSQGKEAVNAVRNLFRMILTEHLRSNPVVWNALMKQYVDFKSMEFPFDKRKIEDPKIFKAQLFGVVRDAQIEFEHHMFRFFGNDGTKMTSFLQEHGIAGDLRAWHTFGVSEGHPDLAATAARFAPGRFDREKSVPLNPVEFSEAQAASVVDKIEALRQSLSQSLIETNVMAPYEGQSEKVLSHAAIDILRKVKASNLDEYVASVQKTFKTNHGVTLNREQVIELRDYFTLTDIFQPNIRSAKRTEIALTGGKHGIQNVDFAGQNIFNFYHTMGALTRASSSSKKNERGKNAVIFARENEALATARLEKLKEGFDGNRSDAGFSGEYQLSGDDGVVVLQNPVTVDNHNQLYRSLLKQGNIADYRMVYVAPPTSSEKRNDAGFLSGEIVRGETLEKALRKSLQGKISAQDLERVGFPVHIDPNQKHIEIIIVTDLDAKTAESIAEAAKRFPSPDGYQTTQVRLLSPNGD